MQGSCRLQMFDKEELVCIENREEKGKGKQQQENAKE